jgi:hypothetical protein
LLICLPFSAFVLISFWGRPRLWLHSLPPDIAQMAGPKTETEEKQTRFLLLPLLLILPGLSIASAVFVARTIPIDLSILGAFIHLYGIWIIVHVWDFVVIDCAHILLINPQHPPIPGTAGAKGYRDYKFHFRSLLRAVPMSLLFVAPSAVVVSLVF